jgi:multidrug efflux system outer membrane protein
MRDFKAKFIGNYLKNPWRSLPDGSFYFTAVAGTPPPKGGSMQEADSPTLPAQPRLATRSFMASALFSAASLSACTLDWEKPEVMVETPPAFRAAKPKAASPIAGARGFAAQFGSKELTALVERALEQNLDISAAVARIEQADAQARINSSPLWPTLTMNDIVRRTQTPGGVTTATTAGATASSSGSTTTTSGSGSSLVRTRRFNFLQSALSASYELDFWGKNYDGSQAARLLANASRFDRDVVEIATVASLFNAYFQVLAAQDRLRIAHENIATADTVLRGIKKKLEVGIGTALDESQQASVLAAQRALVPPLEQTLRQTKNTLAVLMGETPESVDIKGGTLVRLRFPVVKPGLPSQLLLRRPDVAEAEEKLASQEFSVRQARAAFFPSIQMTGLYGVQSVALKSLFRPEAIAWQIVGNLAQPLFDGYNLQGQFMLTKSRYAELAALYQKQILTALSDVENALIAVSETRRQLTLQAEAAAAARRAYRAAKAQLDEGIIDIAVLSTTETTMFQNLDLLAQVRLAHFQAATSLYQALGGGWDDVAHAVEIADSAAAYEADKGPWP